MKNVTILKDREVRPSEILRDAAAKVDLSKKWKLKKKRVKRQYFEECDQQFLEL